MKYIIYVISFILYIGLIYAYECNYGNIILTNAECGAGGNNMDIFNVGDIVYVKGYGYSPNCSVSWYVESQCTPKQIKTVGWASIGTYGDFCVPINVIQQEECNKYEVYIEQQHRGYSISTSNTIPEFTTMGVGIALLGSGLIYFIKRK